MVFNLARLGPEGMSHNPPGGSTGLLFFRGEEHLMMPRFRTSQHRRSSVDGEATSLLGIYYSKPLAKLHQRWTIINILVLSC